MTNNKKLNFKFFSGESGPDPPKLACPFGPRFNLHRLVCFMGQLWELLLTLIR